MLYVTTLHSCNPKVSTPCRLTWAIGRTTAGLQQFFHCGLILHSPPQCYAEDSTGLRLVVLGNLQASSLDCLGLALALHQKCGPFSRQCLLFPKKKNISRGKCPNSNVCSCLPGSLSSSLRMAMLLQHLSDMSREQLSWWRHGGHEVIPKTPNPFMFGYMRCFSGNFGLKVLSGTSRKG